jgi:hypothetical protein
VRHRRGVIGEHKVAQQRLHDQLHALCPGFAAPAGHGRALPVDSVIGQAVLDCAAAFAGRPPSVRSLRARAHGRILDREADFWIDRWRGCLPPPADAAARAARLTRSLTRWRALNADNAAVDTEIAVLLAGSDGQVLTTLPGVATSRAAAFAAFSLPIARFPNAEHLYSATGLAPASYRSATINRRSPPSAPHRARTVMRGFRPHPWWRIEVPPPRRSERAPRCCEQARGDPGRTSGSTR